MTMLRIYKLSPPGAQVIDFNYVEKICVGTKQVGIQVFKIPFRGIVCLVTGLRVFL